MMPERVITTAELRHQLSILSQQLESARLAIVGKGQPYVYPNTSRIGVVAIHGNARPKLIWDHYVADDAALSMLTELSALATCRRGALDYRHEKRWRFAWSEAPSKIVLLNRKGVVLEALDDGRVSIRGVGALDIADIARVAVRASSVGPLLKYAVNLERMGGATVQLASRLDFMHLLDATYNSLDELLFTDWARALAAAIGEGLGVEVVVDEELNW